MLKITDCILQKISWQIECIISEEHYVHLGAFLFVDIMKRDQSGKFTTTFVRHCEATTKTS